MLEKVKKRAQVRFAASLGIWRRRVSEMAKTPEPSSLAARAAAASRNIAAMEVQEKVDDQKLEVMSLFGVECSQVD